MIKHIKHIFSEFEFGIDRWDKPQRTYVRRYDG